MKPIPAAKGIPLLGNSLPMAADLRGFLTDRYLSLGPVFRVSAPNRRYVVLAGPDANALMRADGDRLFLSGDTWRELDASLGADNPMMTSLDGAAHKTVRSGLKEGYAGSTLFRQMDKLVDNQLRLMQAWPRDEAFPAVPRVKRLIASLLGYMATDHAPDGVMDDLAFFFRWILQIHVLKNRPRVLRHWPRYVRARRAVLDMARRIWDERHSTDRPGGGHNFVDTVDRFRARHPDLMTENDAVAALIAQFVAGLDTAASVLSFMLFHVLKDRELKRTLVEEAEAAFADGLPTHESLRRMVATRQVAMEALRMYPPAPALIRTAARDFEFEGYTIPAGAQCMVAFTVTHYLPEFFPHPERFDIERYSPARREHMRPNAYSPYGLGSHMCLGASTANLMYLIVTAVLFRHFDVEMRPANQALHTVMRPLLAPNHRFRIAVVDRDRRPDPVSDVISNTVCNR